MKKESYYDQIKLREERNNVLGWAIKGNQMHIIKNLLENYDLYFPTAIGSSDSETFEEVVEHGLNVAIYNHQNDLVSILLKYIEKNKTEFKSTFNYALLVSIMAKNKESLNMLLSHGANVNYQYDNPSVAVPLSLSAKDIMSNEEYMQHVKSYKKSHIYVRWFHNPIYNSVTYGIRI